MRQFLFISLLTSLFLLVSESFASVVPSAPEMPAKSFILIDHDTGKVLAEKNEPAMLATSRAETSGPRWHGRQRRRGAATPRAETPRRI